MGGEFRGAEAGSVPRTHLLVHAFCRAASSGAVVCSGHRKNAWRPANGEARKARHGHKCERGVGEDGEHYRVDTQSGIAELKSHPNVQRSVHNAITDGDILL